MQLADLPEDLKAEALQRPTYRIADVTNPILKPWAAEQMRKANEEVFNGKIPFVPRERCWPAGTPAYVLEPPFNITVFIETEKEILIVHQQDAQIRRIFLNVPHSKNPKPSWTGESVGHYEGDELVVDTIGFNDKTFVDNYRTPHTERLHVVERWTRSQDGKTLEVIFNVDDPDTFKEPWSAIQRYRRVEQPFVEQACAESRLAVGDLDWVIPHQANLRIINAAAENLEIPPEKLFVNLQKYGNTSGGSIPIVSDFENEFQMTLMNRHLEPGVETVFMMPAEQYTYISSRLIKEVFSLGGAISGDLHTTFQTTLLDGSFHFMSALLGRGSDNGVLNGGAIQAGGLISGPRTLAAGIMAA